MLILLDILIEFLGRGIGPSQGLYLHRTTEHTHTQNAEITTPRPGFELTIPVLESSEIYAA
jgi:hypothetical protein